MEIRDLLVMFAGIGHGIEVGSREMTDVEIDLKYFDMFMPRQNAQGWEFIGVRGVRSDRGSPPPYGAFPRRGPRAWRPTEWSTR